MITVTFKRHQDSEAPTTDAYVEFEQSDARQADQAESIREYIMKGDFCAVADGNRFHLRLGSAPSRIDGMAWNLEETFGVAARVVDL